MTLKAEEMPMRRAFLTIVVSFLLAHSLRAQTPQVETPNTQPIARLQAKAVVAAATVPYCVDLAWQLPLGSRLGWLTSSVANPDPARAPARVFLVRGTGTVFSPGFGDLCTKLRRAGIWAEDLGPVGDLWICRHLISEQRAGRLQGSIVLLGHSRGGRHVLDAAGELGKAGIDVDLLVCVDTALPPLVPINVRRVLNVYMSKQLIYPADLLTPAAESATRVENFDIDHPESSLRGAGLHHLNITANPAVQEFLMQRIMDVARATPQQ